MKVKNQGYSKSSQLAYKIVRSYCYLDDMFDDTIILCQPKDFTVDEAYNLIINHLIHIKSFDRNVNDWIIRDSNCENVTKYSIILERD